MATIKNKTTNKYIAERIVKEYDDGSIDVEVLYPQTLAEQVIFGDSDVQTELEEVRALAEGRSKSTAYSTEAAMRSALEAAGPDDFELGDNIFIRATDVPDYWISNTYSTKQTTNIATGKFGYYEVSPLETQKVDLTPYQTKTDNSLNTTSKTVVGAINEVKNNFNSIISTNGTEVAKASDSDKLDGKHASEFVDRSTNQEIDGNKTFSGTTTTNGLISETLEVHESIQMTASGSDVVITGGTNNGSENFVNIAMPSKSGTLATTDDLPASISDLTDDTATTPVAKAVDADTLDGKHASEFAKQTNLDEAESDISTLIALTTTLQSDVSEHETSITNILNGTSTVARAVTASTATSAIDATQASKWTTARTVTVKVGSGVKSDGSTAITGSGNTSIDGSENETITVNLADSGVTAGDYSAVRVNSKGIVTAAAKSIEFGTSTNNTPSDDLMVGGLFFELVN